jgi:hypothetical protein
LQRKTEFPYLSLVDFLLSLLGAGKMSQAAFGAVFMITVGFRKFRKLSDSGKKFPAKGFIKDFQILNVFIESSKNIKYKLLKTTRAHIPLNDTSPRKKSPTACKRKKKFEKCIYRK